MGLKHSPNLALLFLLGLFSLFVAYHIYLMPPWFDEIISLLHISGNAMPAWESGIHLASVHKMQFDGTTSYGQILDSSIQTDVHPPLYFFVSLAWSKLFGNNIESVRMISLLATVITGYLLYKSAEVRKSNTGLLTVLIFLSFPLTTWSAVNARDYALSLVPLMAAIYCFSLALSLKEVEQNSKRISKLILLTGLFTGIAFLTHYFTVLVTAFVYLALILTFWRTHLIPLIKGGLLALVCFIAIIPILSIHFGARPGQYSGFVSFFTEASFVVQSILAVFAEVPDSLPLKVLYALFYSLMLLFFVVIVVRDNKEKRHQGTYDVLIPVCFAMSLYLLFYITDKSLSASTLNRYVAFITPFIAIISARSLTVFFEYKKRVGVLASIPFVLFTASTWLDGKVEREPWDTYDKDTEIVTYLSQHGIEDSIVIVPVGYGRGTVGKWSHMLSNGQPMLILHTDADLDNYRSQIRKATAIVVVDDNAKKMTDTLETFFTQLSNENYQLYQRYSDVSIWQK